jgi:hypothetical protein
MDRFFISSADTNLYFTGDIVNASSANGSLITNPSSATGIVNEYAMLGVFQGCEYFNTAVGRTVWSSFYPGANITGSGLAYVITDPEQRYIVQGTSGGVLSSTSVGLGYTASIVVSSLGNQTTGQSVMTLASSFPTGLSSNAVIRVLDLYSNSAPPGVNGTSSGAEGFQIAIVQLQGLIQNQGGGFTYPTT